MLTGTPLHVRNTVTQLVQQSNKVSFVSLGTAVGHGMSCSNSQHVGGWVIDMLHTGVTHQIQFCHDCMMNLQAVA